MKKLIQHIGLITGFTLLIACSENATTLTAEQLQLEAKRGEEKCLELAAKREHSCKKEIRAVKDYAPLEEQDFELALEESLIFEGGLELEDSVPVLVDDAEMNPEIEDEIVIDEAIDTFDEAIELCEVTKEKDVSACKTHKNNLRAACQHVAVLMKSECRFDVASKIVFNRHLTPSTEAQSEFAALKADQALCDSDYNKIIQEVCIDERPFETLGKMKP